MLRYPRAVLLMRGELGYHIRPAFRPHLFVHDPIRLLAKCAGMNETAD